MYVWGIVDVTETHAVQCCAEVQIHYVCGIVGVTYVYT